MSGEPSGRQRGGAGGKGLRHGRGPRRVNEVLEQERRLRLSEEGMAAFLEALEKPPEPNDKLKRLMAG